MYKQKKRSLLKISITRFHKISVDIFLFYIVIKLTFSKKKDFVGSGKIGVIN